MAKGRLVAAAGLGLLALSGGCAAPAVQAAVVDSGSRIDPATLEGFQRGITTRAEAVRILGEPAALAGPAADGSTTLTWNYLHADAQGSLAITTVLKFGPDDRLELKLVNESRQITGGSGTPPS